MKNKETYEEMEYTLNAMSKLCTNLQTDKINLGDLIVFLRQENEQLKRKNKDLAVISDYYKDEIDAQIGTTIKSIFDEYHYTFSN